MKRIPICLKPVAKDYIWGGSRLNDDYNFGCSADPFAEAWVCSTHSDGLSFISSPSAAVQTTLLEYLRQEKEMLGKPVRLSSTKIRQIGIYFRHSRTYLRQAGTWL